MAKKQYMTTTYGGGEKVKKEVEAETREQALEKAPTFPWPITKVTARKPKPGEKDDTAELKF